MSQSSQDTEDDELVNLIYEIIRDLSGPRKRYILHKIRQKDGCYQKSGGIT